MRPLQSLVSVRGWLVRSVRPRQSILPYLSACPEDPSFPADVAGLSAGACVHAKRVGLFEVRQWRSALSVGKTVAVFPPGGDAFEGSEKGLGVVLDGPGGQECLPSEVV